VADSDYFRAVDEIQKPLRAFLKERGFGVRGRTFNRTTEDGLTQVIGVQMGGADPPGTTYIPGVRENLHGLFTINVGVYVPEVARMLGGEAKSWVQAHHCSVRSRLAEACGAQENWWWPARADAAVIKDLVSALTGGGLPFLNRFSTREKILTEWRERSENLSASNPPRPVMAIILAERGERDRARDLLARQIAEPQCNPMHADFVRRLAGDLGVGPLLKPISTGTPP
jgi:hypothetical protein